jgi:hypothetical protein
MATSQTRTIATLISEAAIVRMTSNCSASTSVIANPAGGGGTSRSEQRRRRQRCSNVTQSRPAQRAVCGTTVRGGRQGPLQTLEEAMLRADAGDFSVAVLDFGVGPETASPVVRRLPGLPSALYTGKSPRDSSLAEWSDCLMSASMRVGVRGESRSGALTVIWRAGFGARPGLRLTCPPPKGQPASRGRGSVGS